MMKLKNKIFYKSFAASYDLIRKDYLKLSFPLLSDLLLLFLYGSIVMSFIAALVANQMADFLAAVVNLQSGGYTGTMFNETTKPIIINFLLLVLLMIVITYILFCLFQGYSWWYCSKLAGRKNNMKYYIKSFYKVNIFWFVLFVIYQVFIFARALLNNGEFRSSIIINILIFIMLYFIMISYSRLPKKKGINNIKNTFHSGLIKIKEIFPAYTVIFLVFIMIDLLLSFSLKVSSKLFIFLGVFLLMPAVSWARIYFILAVDKL